MNERKVVEALGPPDEIGGECMKALDWQCSRCGRHHHFDVPAPTPWSCDGCGGMAFETGEV